jgi:anti-anti-sigma factor
VRKSDPTIYGDKAQNLGQILTGGPNSGRRLWRLHTKTKVEEGNPVLFVEGRLDHAAAEEFEKAALRHVSVADGNVVIDLSGVDYLSSSALAIFQFLADRQLQHGGRLQLRAPSVAARLTLELSGLQALIE